MFTLVPADCWISSGAACQVSELLPDSKPSFSTWEGPSRGCQVKNPAINTISTLKARAACLNKILTRPLSAPIKRDFLGESSTQFEKPPLSECFKMWQQQYLALQKGFLSGIFMVYSYLATHAFNAAPAKDENQRCRFDFNRTRCVSAELV
jgi:hypothetical protein